VCCVAVCVLLAQLVWTVSASASPVSVGHSGWTWGDPTPQGSGLDAVTFQGSVGFAVGTFGTVLRSEDGGETWEGLPSGTRNNLSLVQELSPTTAIVAGECTVRESVNGGASFTSIPIIGSESKCPSDVAAVSFFEAAAGFVELENGTVLLTSEEGQTVTSKTPVPLDGGTPEQLMFLSPTTGFAVVGGGGGRIYRTTDGANSWTQVASAPASLSDLTFVTPTTAYAVGENSTLLESTDEGTNWTPLPLTLPPGTSPLTLTHITCGDPLHCLMTTPRAPLGLSNVLVRTADGGITGSLVSASEASLLSVAFSTPSNVVAVGEYGATVLSSNGGASFPTVISHNLGRGLLGLIRLGESPFDAYVPWPSGEIAATTNGGSTWSLLRVPTGESIEDVAFPTTTVGYALDSGGDVFGTTDGGLRWSILSASGTPAVSLLAPSLETVLLIGPRGIRRSTDGGQRFQKVQGHVVDSSRHHRRRVYQLAGFDLSRGGEVAGGAVFAFGEDVLESTDGGRTWKLIQRPLTRHKVTAIAFVNATTGYVASDNRLFFTSTAGRRWNEIESVNATGVSSIGRISFSSPSTGYIVGEFNGQEVTVQRTEDGGRTWTPEVASYALSSVTAGGAVDYGEGAPITSLFETDDGGLSPQRSSITLSIAGPSRLTERELRHRKGRVQLSGRISPALGGEPVEVQWVTGEGAWRFKNVLSTSSGSFALTVPAIAGTTDFIAQWTGNDVFSGAGTPAVRLTVRRS
jgi:photosystem II stability/assembly factor-like uncharacterized protein